MNTTDKILYIDMNKHTIGKYCIKYALLMKCNKRFCKTKKKTIDEN